MTGFIVNVFPFRNRVSFKEAFEGLELGEGKLSRPVLRGPGGRKAAWLLGDHDYQISGVTLLPQLRSRTTVSETAVADLYLIKVEIMDPTTTGTSKNKRETYPASKITAACNLLERFI
jgi:hypothetical protein